MGGNMEDLFSNLSVHQNHLGGLLKQELLGPNSGVADSVGLEWGLKICASNKFPGDTNATGLGNHPFTLKIAAIEVCKKQ